MDGLSEVRKKLERAIHAAYRHGYGKGGAGGDGILWRPDASADEYLSNLPVIVSEALALLTASRGSRSPLAKCSLWTARSWKSRSTNGEKAKHGCPIHSEITKHKQSVSPSWAQGAKEQEMERPDGLPEPSPRHKA